LPFNLGDITSEVPLPTLSPSLYPLPLITSQNPQPSPAISPTSIAPTPTLSQYPSPSSSTTQQPTLSSTQPMHSLPSQNYASIIISLSLLVAIAIVTGVLVYYKKIKN
jgi:hypothetical protein